MRFSAAHAGPDRPVAPRGRDATGRRAGVRERSSARPEATDARPRARVESFSMRTRSSGRRLRCRGLRGFEPPRTPAALEQRAAAWATAIGSGGGGATDERWLPGAEALPEAIVTSGDYTLPRRAGRVSSPGSAACCGGVAAKSRRRWRRREDRDRLPTQRRRQKRRPADVTDPVPRRVEAVWSETCGGSRRRPQAVAMPRASAIGCQPRGAARRRRPRTPAVAVPRRVEAVCSQRRRAAVEPDACWCEGVRPVGGGALGGGGARGW